MSNRKNILWGLFLIVIGLILGLNSLGITNINLFFDGWWTLFIIIPCFIDLFNEKDKTGNIIGLIIGVFLLLSAQGIVDFEIVFKLAIPMLFVVIGLSLIFKNKERHEKVPDVENELEYASTFSGQNIDFDNKEFKGCDLDAIFGGINCDLDKSKIKDGSVINACSIFGKINIIVPIDVKVIIKSTSIFGGVSNKHINDENSKKLLYINALCLFGGVDINDKDTKNN